jgi:hypothetical protein
MTVLTRSWVFAACIAAASLPAFAQAKKTASKSSAPAAPAAQSSAPPKFGVAIDTLLDRRSTGDFPSPSLTVGLKLEGEDAGKIASARPRASRAVDDNVKSLIPDPSQKGMMMGSANWQQARESGSADAAAGAVEPAAQGESLASLEGVVEAYRPRAIPPRR